MTKTLTKKEKGFVKDYIKTGNGTKAVLSNYDTESENTAAAIASENLRKPKIINFIQESIPDDLLARVHLEGLDAKKTEGDGMLPDYAVRHKYLDTAYKLKGLYGIEPDAQKKTEGNTYNFIFSKEVQDEVKLIEDRIKSQLIKHVSTN